MVYLQSHNRSSGGRRKLTALIFAGFLIIFILIQWLAPHFIPAVFSTIARPFWRIEFSIQQGSLRTGEALLNENAELRRQIDDLNVRLLTTTAVGQENNELKALLGRPVATTSSSTISGTSSMSISRRVSKQSFQPILAAVLKRPPMALYDELIIDVGSDQNVVVGQSVYAEGNVLIGKISDVLSDTSKVQLLSSPNSTFDIRIGSSSVNTTAHGKGGGQYSAELPRDIVVSPGDVITSPAFSLTTIGTVGAVIIDPTQPFETILFAPPVSVYGLKWVLVDIHATSTSSRHD